MSGVNVCASIEASDQVAAPVSGIGALRITQFPAPRRNEVNLLGHE